MLDTTDLQPTPWFDPSAPVMRQCREALARHFTPDEAEKWLTTPHQALLGRTACFCIGAGQGARVLEVIRSLDTVVELWSQAMPIEL